MYARPARRMPECSMKLLVIFALAALLVGCQATPTQPDPDPDPLAITFRTYYATGGGAQLLLFEDVLATEPVTATLYAACTIDEGNPVPAFVWFEGTVDLETQGANRAIPRQSISVDAGPGIIDCWPITASVGGESVSITER